MTTFLTSVPGVSATEFLGFSGTPLVHVTLPWEQRPLNKAQNIPSKNVGRGLLGGSVGYASLDLSTGLDLRVVSSSPQVYLKKRERENNAGRKDLSKDTAWP